MAMKEIANYYKTTPGKVPRLARVKVKSDGQRSQYKGELNLGATYGRVAAPSGFYQHRGLHV